ncbi:hypothetical protein [Caldivirga maquilingensis]|uniref:hypothetical protein n=1 Tax=Caldivirga maquilingensis TaxID=76887 RepID=UPI00064FC10F|nr:hypothetical protein [Caldivirga maquilingensis]
MPKLPARVKRIMIIIGVAAVITAGILLYLSHVYLSLSSKHNATTLCLEFIGTLTEMNLVNKSSIVSMINNYTKIYHVSMKVTAYALNGTLLFSYGSYIPPILNGGQSSPSIISSSQVSILNYGVCQYYGKDLIWEVQIGTLPEALYLFVAGLALVFIGLALVAIGV